MSQRCEALGCEKQTRYLMCPAHWRMVPPEIKRVWEAQFRETRDGPWRLALWENLAELQRVVRAIEQGVPA